MNKKNLLKDGEKYTDYGKHQKILCCQNIFHVRLSEQTQFLFANSAERN